MTIEDQGKSNQANKVQIYTRFTERGTRSNPIAELPVSFLNVELYHMLTLKLF